MGNGARLGSGGGVWSWRRGGGVGRGADRTDEIGKTSVPAYEPTRRMYHKLITTLRYSVLH